KKKKVNKEKISSLSLPSTSNPLFLLCAPAAPHHLFPTFHTPIPIDMRHHEGRYHYEPHALHAMHSPAGLTSSPVISDISLIRLSPAAVATGDSPFSPPHPYVNPHMEHYLRSVHGSPTLSMISAARGLSPADLAHEHLKERGLFGLPPPPPGASPAEYYHLMASHRSPYGELLMQGAAGAAAAAGAHLSDYITPIDVSRFSSPRLTPRLSRKRALSISPLSDASIDLQTMIRTSPNSLVAYINNSRSSSAASSSYGHLSVGGLSPSFPFPHPINPVAYQQLLSQQRGLSAFGHTPPLIQAPPTFPGRQSGLVSKTARNGLTRRDGNMSISSLQNHGGDPAVSSTVDPLITKRSKVKAEADGLRPSTPCSPNHLLDLKDDADRDECKQEPEAVYETNCHWEGCSKEYETQEQLVHHINNDHIHGEKKEFVCRWEDCSREQKPFKAQYMLVVHMRRHTGEKPHKCTVGNGWRCCAPDGAPEGAFSNASDRAKHQNRTHSNEKPYVCKIPGCTKRYTDPSSLRKHVKTVHGPEAHVTKKQRGDAPPRPPAPRENGENETGARERLQRDDKLSDGGSLRGVEDYLHVKSIKTENSVMYQSSPGGQSSCSSEPSPLGSATNNDSGVEMAAHSGGSLGDLSALDDPPLAESLGFEESAGGVAAVGLRFRKQLSTSQRLEHLKKEKLKTVRDSCRWANNPTPAVLGTKLPPISARSLLESQSMGGGPLSFPGSGLGELSTGNMTLLENLSERRDSTCSTLSSVYTLSRRSSGISPGFSSRRSSQTSQFGANRPNNVSSADSYDPISVDISRRSSQTSQCGGSGGGPGGCGGGGFPSPLSLTPAQHYRLKAKYAAATGGAPPTPLPYMDHMFLKAHSGLYGDAQGGPKQYSSCNTRSLMPHEVPSHIPRRASDPVRQAAADSPNQPQMQRYNSMGALGSGLAMQPRPPPGSDRRRLSQQGCLRPDGGLSRYPYSLRPPSILENSTMESMNGFPDNRDAADRTTAAQQDFPGSSALQQQMCYHRKTHLLANASPGRQPQMNQPVPSSSTASAQWNKVTPGVLDPAQDYSKLPQRGNLAVLQQSHNFGPVCHNLSHQQATQGVTNTMQQRCVQLTSDCFQSTNLNEALSTQCRFDDGSDPNGNAAYAACSSTGAASGSTLSPGCKQEPVDMDVVDMHFANVEFQPVEVKVENCDGLVAISDQQNCNTTSQNPANQNCLLPRPPAEPNPISRLSSALKLMQQTRHPSNTGSDAAGELSPSRSVGLFCSSSGADDNAMYYTGQIQLFGPSGNMAAHSSPVVTLPPFDSGAALRGSGESCAVRAGDSDAALEPAQIDFESMLDDGDRSSLVSGTLSPGLLQSLSQSSSRLTTPRNSVTLPPVPAGTGNMAIGDMSSLLTALAEESKFLDLMSSPHVAENL
uniref:GLI family zinc finger 2b n=1 Tax=Salarias fasciatus TaxID=181472 RepID=A0A672FQP2_SALFA